MSADLIRELEARSMTAWPSFQTIIDDGWVQRFAGGYSGRANSVYPLYPGLDALDAKIDRAEARYRALGIKPAFKLTLAAEPSHLEAALEQRGYQRARSTSLQIAELTAENLRLTAPPTTECLIETRLTGDWLALAGVLREMPERDLELMAQVLRLLVVPTAFVRLLANGEPVAVGMGVLDAGWIGLFDIATDPAERGKGFGRAICQQIMAWAQAQGAHHAYLQVMLHNAPALRLYQSLGYQEVYQYWYREWIEGIR
jgi:N-acetylglutamate synthase